MFLVAGLKLVLLGVLFSVVLSFTMGSSVPAILGAGCMFALAVLTA